MTWSKTIHLNAGIETTNKLLSRFEPFPVFKMDNDTSNPLVGWLHITRGKSHIDLEVQTGSLFEFDDYYMKVTYLWFGEMYLLVSNKPIPA